MVGGGIEIGFSPFFAISSSSSDITLDDLRRRDDCDVGGEGAPLGVESIDGEGDAPEEDEEDEEIGRGIALAAAKSPRGFGMVGEE